jgi:hypothetical protein
MKTGDFSSAEPAPPAPRRVERRQPYEPLPPDLDRIPEMRAAAVAERDRSAAVQAFQRDQQAKHQRIVERGPAIAHGHFLKLPEPAEIERRIEEARQHLHAKIEARDGAKGAWQAAVRAAEAGNSEAERLSGELSAADQVDQEIAEYQAACIRSGEAADVLPESLLQRRADRDRLRQQHEDAAAAVAVLQADMERRQQQLAEAEAVVSERIAVLLDATSEKLAGAMLAAQRRASTLRSQLDALGAAIVSGRRYQLPVAVLQSMRDAEALQTPRAGDPAAWREVVEQLRTDASTALPLMGETK